jgi:hypothetical protein
MTKGAKLSEREIWRLYLKRLDERLRSPDAHPIAPLTKTISNAVVYGLNQLEPAPVESAPEMATGDKSLDGVVSDGLPTPPHDQGDFVERWAIAMCREMGAEELEKFALTLGEPDHRDTKR